MASPTMRALFFPEARRFDLREVPLPEPSEGEARIRVLYCGICGSDLSVFETGALAGAEVVLGHEIVGEVDFDPTGTHPPGTRVVVYPAVGCGDCHWCARNEPRHCENPSRRWGGFAEYAVYPARNLIPVPDDLSHESAALADPVAVAVRAVEIARPDPGSVVYVGGLGPLGLSVVSVLAARGCRVIGGELRPERADLAESLGAHRVIDPTRVDPYQAGRELDPGGPRCAFECSGSPEGLQDIFDACGPLGTVGILGIPKVPVLLLRMTVREQRAFSISGPTLGSMVDAVRHLAAHPELGRMITETVPLETAQHAFERLADGSGGVKVLVNPRL